MSGDIDAVQSIEMIAARRVDVNEWLFVESDTDAAANEDGRIAAISPKTYGGIHLNDSISPGQCGALFVSEVNHSLTPKAGALLRYFFERDKAEAVVFEFDKFERHFHARSWKQVSARIR